MPHAYMHTYMHLIQKHRVIRENKAAYCTFSVRRVLRLPQEQFQMPDSTVAAVTTNFGAAGTRNPASDTKLSMQLIMPMLPSAVAG